MIHRFHAILDTGAAQAAGWALPDLARAFLDGGALCIQIRAKALASGPLLDLCDAIVRLAEPYRARIIVHDRADIAAMSGAAGVHVGQEDLHPKAARAIVGPDAIVGVSTHTTDQVAAATDEPVSYIAIGPVFGTTTKATGYRALGLDLVTAAARQARGRPVVAIGGITLETAPAVLAAGADAVAIISDLLATSDPAERVRRIVMALR